MIWKNITQNDKCIHSAQNQSTFVLQSIKYSCNERSPSKFSLSMCICWVIPRGHNRIWWINWETKWKITEKDGQTGSHQRASREYVTSIKCASHALR